MQVFRRGRYIMLVAVLMLGFCSASAFMLVQLRADSWKIANTSAQNLLTLLSQDIDSRMEAYDAVLEGIVRKVQQPEFASLTPDLQQILLFDQVLKEPYFTSVLVLDAQGNVVRDAGAMPPRQDNFSDRSYFQAHLKGEASGLYISTPFQRRLTGDDDVVGLSRRIDGPDGHFAGVVVATLKLSYFQDLFKRMNLKDGDAINLFSQSGVLVMRSPYIANQIGRDFSASENIKRFQSARFGSFSGVAAIDGVMRLYNFMHVGSRPLILNVALSHDQILSTWRKQAISIGVALALLCGLTIALTAAVRRAYNDRVLAEETTRKSEARYRLLADNATDVIVSLDRDLIRRYVSPASHEMFGMDPGELVGKTARSIIHCEDWPLVQKIAQEARMSSSPVEAIYRLKHRDGHYVWVEGRYRYVAENDSLILVLRDISARKVAEAKLEKANAELARRANTDGLTGLVNRRQFDELLAAEYERANTAGTSLALLLIDVDRFKLFNDTYGHQEGDDCLRLVAQTVQSKARSGDICARYGGEELAVIMRGAGEEEALGVGERIRAAVENLQISHSASNYGHVTISAGCSSAGAEGVHDVKTLIAEADRLLYEAKRTGRNKVIAARAPEFTGGLPAVSDEKRRLETVETYQQRFAEKPNENLNVIARGAAELLGTPIGFVTLAGDKELSLIGRHGIEAETVARDIAFCGYTIAGTDPLFVTDTQADLRFRSNPLVQGLEALRFYAGAPLVDPQTGFVVGTVCVADFKPHEQPTDGQRKLLSDLSTLVIKELN
ncbi:diguanylate cyclase [Oryzifoliimicrobium ureilyticus]|uniref:diguanylate cyclase n=1 Tax=Oryzifoliimicrobium ureilyticus TaxID=3113724 RepID=UPI0030768560